MVGDLSVAHVKRSHQGAEVASRVGRQVPHQASTLVAPIGGLMCPTNHTEEPQACCCGWDSEGFVSKDDGDEQGKQGCGRDNHHKRWCDRCGLFIGWPTGWGHPIVCSAGWSATGLVSVSTAVNSIEGAWNFAQCWSCGRTDGFVGSRPSLLRGP